MRYRSNGKLLISGEYFVLKGALALAIPTSFGQELNVSPIKGEKLLWITRYKKETIFSAQFDLEGKVIESDDETMATKLCDILLNVLKLKSIKEFSPSSFEAMLEFPMKWGLGSSSTLIFNISKYFKVDPFLLLEKTFGGSGYDIACAGSDQPILYSLKNSIPKWNQVNFDPIFKDKLFFVYLNRKMNSRNALRLMAEKGETQIKNQIEKINEITLKLSTTRNLSEFEYLLSDHENIISEFLGIKKIKEEMFNDYPKVIKSLGAWGGDFVMAVGDTEEMNYFRKRGFDTIIPFNEMILKYSENK